jgi:hypothetical protein
MKQIQELLLHLGKSQLWDSGQKQLQNHQHHIPLKVRSEQSLRSPTKPSWGHAELLGIPPQLGQL